MEYSEIVRFGTGPAIGFLIVSLAWNADDALSQDARESLSLCLMSLSVGVPKTNWARNFSKLFDRVFGKRHRTLKCFFRSCLASLITVSFLVLIFELYPAFHPYLTKTEEATKGFDPHTFLLLLIPIFIFNFFPDYLSLLETRFVLRWMSSTRSPLRIFGYLLFDLIATGGIFLASWGYIFLGLYWLFGWELGAVSVLLTIFGSIIWGPIAFWSTFATSIWLWLYGLAYGAFRVVTRFSRAVGFLKWALPIETRPVRSIGLVSGAIGWFFAWVIS